MFVLIGTLIACNEDDTKNIDNPGTADVNAKDSASYTSIEWLDSTFSDLCKVKKGQKVEIIYNFRNSGDKPLLVQRVQPGCGCTVAEFTKEPIAPGETGKIRGEFDSKTQPAGEHRKNIDVLANTKQYPITLSFRVEVVE